MLKQIPVILLLLCFLGQTFSTCFIVIGYQLNKAYIAKNLCENRNKPGMKCEGRCYLCKRLNKEEKKDQENPERKAENKFESAAFYWTVGLHHPGAAAITHYYPRLNEAIYNAFIRECFHPPQC